MTALPLQDAIFREISPAALSGYVRALNWVKERPYRDFSDVYVGENLPEIVVPRTQRIDDYGFVIRRLIEVFCEVTEMEPQAIYHNLVNADRDVLRFRVPEVDDDSPVLEQGVGLISSARDLLLAAVCSFQERRPVYRTGSNLSAMEYLRRVRLGHTEQGSFAVTLLPPVVPPLISSTEPEVEDGWFRNEPQAPLERRMIGHFANVLSATTKATEETAAGYPEAFAGAVSSGVSANFCDAMVSLIGPFPQVEVSVSWALTRPVAGGRNAFSFYQDDSPVLKEAADSFRERGVKHDVRLFGKVGRLAREEGQDDGRITMRTTVEGRVQSVSAVLSWADYEMAIIAHQGGVVLALDGDLERVGQRWHLRNPQVVDIISLDDTDDAAE